jgi:hypothetical protein
LGWGESLPLLFCHPPSLALPHEGGGNAHNN